MDPLENAVLYIWSLPYGWAILLVGVLGGVGFLFLLVTGALRGRTGLPSAAKIIASDTGQNRVKKYSSERFKLTGNPDFIIEEKQGLFGRKKLVPVEMKSWSSKRLYESQEIQLAVYIVLMKEEHGDRAVADYGYVIYKDTPFRVEWNADLAQRLEMHIAGAREVKRTKFAHRSHENRAQCATCAFRNVCDEALS